MEIEFVTKSRGKVDEFVSSNWKTETTTRGFIARFEALFGIGEWHGSA